MKKKKDRELEMAINRNRPVGQNLITPMRPTMERLLHLKQNQLPYLHHQLPELERLKIHKQDWAWVDLSLPEAPARE